MRVPSIRFAALVLLVIVACGAPSTTEELGQALTVCPPTNTLAGFDINGASVDWPTAAAHYRFVYIKATEGNYFINSSYPQDVAGARAAGMYAGAYHYLVWGSTGATQAQYFVKELGGSIPAGDLPPVADIEDVYADDLSSTTVAERQTIISDFVATVQSLTGRQAMIYSGNWYWDSATYLNSPTQFSSYPAWWSDYTTACPVISNTFPTITIWQNAGSVQCTGVAGATGCDTDTFFGTEADLAKLAQKNAYAGESLGATSQSYPIASAGAVTLTVGQTVTGWIKLKNIGTATWAPGVVKLAPIPRDKTSPYQATNWLAANRISTVQASTPPGSVGTFELDIHGSAVGNGTLQLGFVAEGITWFADQGGPPDGYFEVAVDVTAPADTGVVDSNGADSGAVDVGGLDSAVTEAGHADVADAVAAADSGDTAFAREASDALAAVDADESVDAAPAGAPAKGGCSCRTAASESDEWLLPAVFAAAIVMARARRQTPRMVKN
jgi:GH25 family lysozyme M1 (1,4-beta-N-acetylmuramidase)